MILAFFGGLEALVLFLFGGLISLAGFAFWLWMLIHCLTNQGLEGSEKVAWVLVIIFLPFIGSLIYFFIGRPKRKAA
jgi:hypothetical protein